MFKEKEKPFIAELLKKHMNKSGKSKFLNKLILILVLGALFYLLYYNKEFFYPFLQKSPAIWQLYQHSTFQIEQRTLLGLFYANAFGSLFFIVIPLELIFIYYSFLSFNPILLILISLVGTAVGMAFNYLVGYIFSKTLLRLVMKNTFEKMK